MAASVASAYVTLPKLHDPDRAERPAHPRRNEVEYGTKVAHNSYGRFGSLGEFEGVAVSAVTASALAEGSAAQTRSRSRWADRT